MKKIYRSLLAPVLLTLLLTAFHSASYAQQRILTGQVKEESGVPIPGVNILLKGTNVGTATDMNGNFSIQVRDDDVLVVSFIGYESREIEIGTQTKLDIVLREDIATLNEVVVVGVPYGEMKKTNLTSAQTTITSDEIKRTVNTTLEQAIQGRAAGVYVTQNSGQPGGGISVTIRGVNTLDGSNEPLYVIDGVQIQQTESVSYGEQSSANPLAGLNPDDIESIQVLTGPSATAMYGSRGTNGVIQIRTKRGQAGDLKITYGLQYSVQTPPKPLDVLNLREYAQLVNEYHDLAGGNTPESFLDPSLLGEGTDWQKALFKNAPMTKHQLSLSGGTEKTTYYLSGEYLTQEGVSLGSGFDRYSVRLNMDNKMKEWISLGAVFNFSQTDEDLTATQENVIRNAIQLTPQIPVRNLDGSWGGGNETNGANQFARVNPIALATLTTNEWIRREFRGGLNANLTLMKGLTFKTSFNTSLGFKESTYFVPSYRFGLQVNPSASLTNRSNNSTYWNWNQLLQYSYQVGSHDFTIMASHEAQMGTWKNLSATRTGFLSNKVTDLGIGDAKSAENRGGQGDWAMESYFARLTYSFRDRYIFMGTIRRDGSSNFGPENKWGTFPSASAAWRISEEPFFTVPFIGELKLRFETGLTGNNGPGGRIYSPLAVGATQWGSGFLPNRYENPALQWEETLTNNIGINVGLLDNRIDLEFDYYIKDTDNLLLENPLPLYMGTSGQGAIDPPTVNIGALQNKGWGLTINTTNVHTDGFRWNSNLNISAFKTKVTKFYSETAVLTRTSLWLDYWTQLSVIGKAPWQFFGYIEDGLFQSVEEINNSALPVDNSHNELPVNKDNVWVGDVKFKDINNDGVIDELDQTFIGNPWPTYFAGLTNTFSYKNFDLSILIITTQGNDVYNYMAKVNTNPNTVNLSWNMLANARNYARLTDNPEDPVLENPGTNIPRISHGPNGNYERHTSKWVEDGSFVRVRNITLTYNVPSSILSKQKWVRSVRVSASAQNAFTFTRYSGYDPEVGAFVGREVKPDEQAIGLDYGRYPITPVYTFNLSVDF